MKIYATALISQPRGALSNAIRVRPLRTKTIDKCKFSVTIYYAVRIVCNKRHKTVECPSVRPCVRLSVPSIDSMQQRSAGLLLRSPAAHRYRSIAADVARHAGRVTSGPTARRSSILVFLAGQHVGINLLLTKTSQDSLIRNRRLTA